MRKPLLLAACLGACAPSAREGDQPAPTPADTAAAAAPTAAGRGDAVLFRPIEPTLYAITRRDSLELSLPGGASQIQAFDRTAFVRVALEDDSAGYQVTVVLDSIQSGSNANIPYDSLIHAEGTRWTAMMSADGQINGLAADRGGTIVEEVGSNLRFLFPTLPEAGARDQAAWTDTTTIEFRANAFNATERAVTDYVAVQNDTDGQSALRIDGVTIFERSGTGTQYGNEMEMTANGTRRLTYVVGMDGDLLSVQGADSSAMTITVPAVGQTVPVTQQGTVSIMRLEDD